MVRQKSARVRAMRIAERAIGRERNRSTRPPDRSVASATAVVAPKSVASTRRPGSRYRRSWLRH
jgi:hypothetical protein